jgi:hypothetical protein
VTTVVGVVLVAGLLLNAVIMLVQRRSAHHDGDHECGRTACEHKRCATQAGECCEHCPVAYRKTHR